MSLSEDATPVTGPERLLAVQDHDTQIEQLRHRRAHLPERVELREVERALGEVTSEIGSVGTMRDELQRQQDKLDADVAEIANRLAVLDKRMHSGEVTATRELTAMVEQADALKRRRSDLEDAEIELMEAIEPLELSVVAMEERRAELDHHADKLRDAVRRGEEAIDAELGTATAERQAVAAEVPEVLIQAYEKLRSRLGGVGAARLVGSSCGGCHLALPATELDRIRREPPDALVTCDQCGRILVR